MGLLDWLNALFAEGQKPLPTRLSAEQAIELARAAADSDPRRDLLTMTSVRERDGARIWSVSSATVGSALVVELDDATGEILRVYNVGIR